MSELCASRSTILPFPSSPHCAPTTTVEGTAPVYDAPLTPSRAAPALPRRAGVEPDGRGGRRGLPPTRRRPVTSSASGGACGAAADAAHDDPVSAAARRERDVGVRAQRPRHLRLPRRDALAAVPARLALRLVRGRVVAEPDVLGGVHPICSCRVSRRVSESGRATRRRTIS